MIRKFFDIAVAEPATQQQPSIAALMAQHGVKTESDNPVEIPRIEIKKEEPATQPTPVEPTTGASNAEPATTKETPLPTEEHKPVIIPKKEEVPVNVPTWQEVLKQQPDTVLKELLGGNENLVKFVNGLKDVDPKMVAFLNHWKTDGDLKPYLRELTTDYKTMSAEEVMRHQLRLEYPKASDKALNILFQDEIVDKYKLDPEKYSEEEVERGKILLEAKADNYRDKLVQNQENYLFPKPPEPKASEPDLKAQKAQHDFEAYRSYVREGNSYSKSVFSTNQITIGDGEDKFIFPVNPAEIMDMVFDENKASEALFEETTNANGSKSFVPNIEKHWLAGAIMKYGRPFLDAYAKHYKGIGAKAAVIPIDNAKEVNTNVPAPNEGTPKSPAEAMAKSGTFNPGGYR
jgi:hypothetical protein